MARFNRIFPGSRIRLSFISIIDPRSTAAALRCCPADQVQCCMEVIEFSRRMLCGAQSKYDIIRINQCIQSFLHGNRSLETVSISGYNSMAFWRSWQETRFPATSALLLCKLAVIMAQYFASSMFDLHFGQSH